MLLYADDTVMMSETTDGLQNTLNVFKKYCDIWKLKINIQKLRL